MELHLTNLVPDQIIRASCNTLIHSLWQGLILAVAAGLTIILTRKASAALRYNLLVSFLMLFAAAVVLTFCGQIKNTENSVIIPAMAAAPAPSYPITIIAHQETPKDTPASLVNAASNYFNTHADIIVLLWFLIICARCIRFAAGLQSIFYIKRNKVQSAGSYWENTLHKLAENMGIETSISILQSGIAKLPMVLGHFKPVILIPVGLLTALSTEEVEAILIHELAHIRRKDYLVNLLQTLMEIAFFFNPAVLWVSTLIKAERENCCDDIVVAQTCSKVSYIKALVSCEEYHQTTPAYAMGLGGKNGHFLNRVKRMLSNNNQSLNRVEKMVLTICLISAVLITAAFSKSKIEHASLKIRQKSQLSSLNKEANTDNTSTGKTDDGVKIYKNSEVAEGSSSQVTHTANHKTYRTLVFKKAGVLYQYVGTGQQDNTIGAYYVNGVQLPEDKVVDYLRIFQQEKAGHDAAAKKLAQQLAAKQNQNDAAAALQNIIQNQQNNATADTSVKAKKKVGGEGNSEELKRLQMQLKLLQAQHVEDSLKLSQTENHGYQSAGPYGYRPSGNNGYNANRAYVRSPVPIHQSPLQEKSKEIGDELVKENLVGNKSNFTYKLSRDEFYIDGVRQSAALRDRIIDEFFKPDDNFNLGYTFHDPGQDKISYNGSAGDYRNQGAQKRAEEQVAQKAIIADLMKDGIINDNGRNITFKLTGQEFIVNGKKQDDAIFKRYKAKYVPGDGGDNWTWTHTNHQ